MLLGNFYRITESSRDGQTFHVKVEFDTSHPIFKGHFPDLPVVPGVCQTQMLIETLTHLLGRPVEIKHAQHIKFLALLNPVKHNQLALEIKLEKEEDEHILVNAIYFNSEEIFFRFKGEMH